MTYDLWHPKDGQNDDWTIIRERGSVLYLGMAMEILNLP